MYNGIQSNLLRFFLITFFCESRCFSQDYVLRFKIDMRNSKYDNLFCSELPLCSEYLSFCNTYNKDLFKDDTLNEYCYRLKKNCYSSNKCCTGKIGCCNGKCANMNEESFTTAMVNFLGTIFITCVNLFNYVNLIRVPGKEQ